MVPGRTIIPPIMTLVCPSDDRRRLLHTGFFSHRSMICVDARLIVRAVALRDISAELALRGHLNERGQPFSAASINSMLG